MLQEYMEIIENKQIARNTCEIILKGKLTQHFSRPGQFVHIKVGEPFSHPLRRPLSIANVNKAMNELTIVYKAIGEGTTWLSKRREGELIDVLGPLGNGFHIDHIKGERLLVIGGGVGIPPLYYLTKELVKENDVTVILGYQSLEDMFYYDLFEKLTLTIATTDDGSYGVKGKVTDVLHDLKDVSTRYFACGPYLMLKSLKEEFTEIEGFISLEERMGCGIGACFACVCEAKNDKGYVKICKDGPVFHSSEVIL